jgi:hypothetical protein
MKNVIYLCLLGAFCLPLHQACAQEKAQEKPQEKTKSEERAKPGIPIKVQIVLSEYDGDKKISSTPYSFVSLADDKFWATYNTSLRTGVRIPVEIEGKDQKNTYLDVGMNIDCGIRAEDDGRYFVRLSLERSSLYPNKSADGERLVANPSSQPLIRQFRTTDYLILKDGQTSENLLSTDPLSGHTLRVSVTLDVQK